MRHIVKKDEEEKDQLLVYQVLQEPLDGCNKYGIIHVIIIGGFNVKVESDNTRYEKIVSIHWLGLQNKNGKRLCKFCQTNGFMIIETLLLHNLRLGERESILTTFLSMGSLL